MSRSKRLLQLLQILRGYKYPVSASRLAERLEISIRTVYRDIATLQAQGAEIIGESGIGYILKPSFFLPPLMFSEEEIQAIFLGTQWVMQYADAPLSKAAKEALTKIVEVLPAKIKNSTSQFTLRVGPPCTDSFAKEDLSVYRDAIAKQKKIDIVYRADAGEITHDIIWPFTIGYFYNRRYLVAWCERNNEFRHFQTNHIDRVLVLEESYTSPRNRLFHEWHKLQMKKLYQQDSKSPENDGIEGKNL